MTDFPQSTAVTQNSSQPLRMERYTQGDSGRDLVESFVADIFDREYNCQSVEFLPELFALHDDNNRIVAAAGLSAATDGPLRCEQYTGVTIDSLLRTTGHSAVSRLSLFEVGNLSATSLHSARLILLSLAQHLRSLNGPEWIVAALTREGRRIIQSIRWNFTPICKADPSAIPNATESWGTYYEHDPWVVVGQLPSSVTIQE